MSIGFSDGGYSEDWGQYYSGGPKTTPSDNDSDLQGNEKKITHDQQVGDPDHQENFEAAKKDLNLNQQEQDLYQRHLNNLYGSGGVTNSDGSRSSLYQAVIPHNGKYYNVPTVWDGKREVEQWTRPSDKKVFDVPNQKAFDNIDKEGWDRFPSYNTPEEADDRYQKMHDYMEKDTEKYFNFKPETPENQPDFNKGMTAPWNKIVDRSHNVPLIASYTPDGIAIDHRVDTDMEFEGKKHDITPFLVAHENAERVMDDMVKGGMDARKAYELAHDKVANPAEAAVRNSYALKNGLDPDKFNEAYWSHINTQKDIAAQPSDQPRHPDAHTTRYALDPTGKPANDNTPVLKFPHPPFKPATDQLRDWFKPDK